MPDYNEVEMQVFKSILANMDAWGWDLAARHAHQVMSCLRGGKEPTLQAQLTTRRYLLALRASDPRSRDTEE